MSHFGAPCLNDARMVSACSLSVHVEESEIEEKKNAKKGNFHVPGLTYYNCSSP